MGKRLSAASRAGPRLGGVKVKTLSEVVSELKSAPRTEGLVVDRLCDAIAQKDREGCIAFFTWKERWSGFGGLSKVRDFTDAAACVWQNAPEFFVPYDEKRPIDENPSVWTEEYFDRQRGYLRHNFCLERLCHLVMVYDRLHPVETPTSAPKPSVPTPSVTTQILRAPAPKPREKSLCLFLLLLVLIGILFILSVNLKGCYNEKGRETTIDYYPGRDFEGDVPRSVSELSEGIVSDGADATSIGEGVE